jgi:hypothetical protein
MPTKLKLMTLAYEFAGFVCIVLMFTAGWVVTP